MARHLRYNRTETPDPCWVEPQIEDAQDMANCPVKCPKSPCARGILALGLIAAVVYFFRKKKCCG
ncbi:hypothetical protein predicted by Glimmer/Critica [Acetobacter ghanensis]|uniref:Uncharacterized protein n=1 Tax=Acetobacter ghanensis TaxID=431306 RepID=A0A0U5F044_9PROT|nr:hypothetical protein AA18895_1490 [Acetobacter ghanensis DSM 18895]CEF53485.1 hypothetical protein predicted by Glimmer/Critica [Acetobacter ghanensis]